MDAMDNIIMQYVQIVVVKKDIKWISMAKKYNRNNCDSTLRATVTDTLGRTVSLFGTHAFEWSIVIASDNSITMQTFKKGDIARKEFNKYKRKI